jgi:hypothetical protein
MCAGFTSAAAAALVAPLAAAGLLVLGVLADELLVEPLELQAARAVPATMAVATIPMIWVEGR